MDHKEIPTSVPPADERITVVLKAQEGSTLNQIRQFVSLGMPVAIGRGIAVIAGASDEDLQMVLGQERDERQMQAELQQRAIGAPAHLAAHAQEMFDLLVRIDTKCGGLDAALGHGMEPSEQMWQESRAAMEAIWELQDKIQSAAAVDKGRVNQASETGESVNQTTGIPAVTDSMHIDDRVKMVGSEPAFLTVVFELPSLNDAQPLIAQLPYGQKALGTEAVVFGLSTGNLMEDAPCAN
ncbi:hypothetical protein M5G25_19005 [Pseudomonas sp. TNT2022 ID357]|uniref:Uncharacterized protein n=1 Tax=Pseudomonas idahonensis TaxID=2942628 RepID=A0ABT5Q854_9PSED|nr:hypothetical protein [Pseudomonas idahonensis]MDD1150372.1 hypothetical protein [Pseudomonas idahonensis]